MNKRSGFRANTGESTSIKIVSEDEIGESFFDD
jgi:hypothetical protein